MNKLDFRTVKKMVFQDQLDWHCSVIDSYKDMSDEDKELEKQFTERNLRLDLAVKNLDELCEVLDWYGEDPERYILNLLMETEQQDDLVELERG